LISTEFGFSKLGCHIKFPLQFDLSPYCSFDLSECTVPEELGKSHSTQPIYSTSSSSTSMWSDLSSKYKTPISGTLLNSCVGGDNSYARAPTPKLMEEQSHFDHDNPPKSMLNSKNSSSTVPVLYNLVSVVEHSGNHSGGHYTVYKKDSKHQQWFHISDERVTPVDDVRNANAYMLFYEKIE